VLLCFVADVRGLAAEALRGWRGYLATSVDGGNPDSWPAGGNVLFFDAFDLFNSSTGAQNVEGGARSRTCSRTRSRPNPDTSLGSGEKVLRLQSARSPLLSSIIYVQRGSFIPKIAGCPIVVGIPIVVLLCDGLSTPARSAWWL